jgi:type II/III secretion system protein
MKRLSIAVLALLLVSLSAFADAGEMGKNLSVKTFQFKHKQAENAASVIKALMSAEGSMSIQPNGNSLIVTDLAENMKKIAAALAAFDTPPQPFRLTVRLVSARRGTAEEARVDSDLSDVSPKLALLRYNVLERVGSAEVTGKEGEPGLVDLGTYRADFHFGEYDPASDSLKVGDFRLARLEGDQLAPMMKTTLNLKLGQTVIIGVTKEAQSQRALMIVVTAKR